MNYEKTDKNYAADYGFNNKGELHVWNGEKWINQQN